MRGLTLGLLALTLAACTTPPGAPETPTVTRDTQWTPAGGTTAPGDTLRYTLSLATPAARATSYQWTTTTPDAGWTGMLVGATTTALSIPFTPVHLTPWDSVHFSACVRAVNSKGMSAPSCVSWTLLRGPGMPGEPAVDSSLVIAAVVLRPEAAALAVVATQQFCAYFRALDGHVRLGSGYEALAACREHYDTMMGHLPGYPVAMASAPSQWVVPGGLRLAVRTPRDELAHLLFAGPFG